MTAIADITAAAHDDALLEGLRRRDERSFLALVERHGPLMLRIATRRTGSQASAEAVVLETWLAVLDAVDGSDARLPSFRAWLIRRLVERADARAVPADGARDEEAPAVDPGHFVPSGPWAGHWAVTPRHWGHRPTGRLLGGGTLAEVAAAIDALPLLQHRVVVLRDVEGWSPAEVGCALGLADADQRAILHRGRTRLRARLEVLLERADSLQQPQLARA